MSEQGFIVWLTGLPSSGKSTLAFALAETLRPTRRVEVLDADYIRKFICPDLGFSREDRDQNVHRIAFVARMLARNGVIAIVAAISPYAETRFDLRRLAEDECIPFIEVHAHLELDVAIRRDVKGLYKKALNGQIKNFTGMDDPYEAPVDPEVRVRTDECSVEDGVKGILDCLHHNALITRFE